MFRASIWWESMCNLEPSIHRHRGSQSWAPHTLLVAEHQPGRGVKMSKWSSIPLWLLTGARTIKDISLHLPTFSGRWCLLLFPESWDRSTIFDPRPSKRVMKFRLFKDIYKGQQIGKAVQVYRKKYVIYIDRVQQEKTSGTTFHAGIHPSKLVITSLQLDRNAKRPWKLKPNITQWERKRANTRRNNWEDVGVRQP